jgi:dTDP-glucose 4,6-dehydratase
VSKKCLLTGGCGFIGSHMTEYLLRHTDWRIVILDRIDAAGDLNRLYRMPSWGTHRHRVEFRHHDLRAAISPGVAAELLSPFGLTPFDRVIHLAAGSHVDRSVSEPTLFVLDNVLGTEHLLEALLRPGFFRKDTGRILHFSTDEVFGAAPPGVAFKPWDRFNATNPYAATKVGAEALALACAYTFDLPLVVSHCTNVIGPGAAMEKFLCIAMACIADGIEVPIHAVDGKVCSRFYVDVENVCSATLAILERGTTVDGSERAGRYNISGDADLSNIELCKMVARIMGKEFRYRLVENPSGRLKPDLRYCIDDAETRALGWKPPVKFEDGLARTVEAFLRRHETKRASAQ